MKLRVLAMSCLLLLSIAVSAHAEHKLLITDVLDAGQVEAEADFNYSHYRAKSTLKPFDLTAQGTTNSYGSLYSLGLGVGSGLQFIVSIPYEFSARTKTEINWTPPSTHYSKGNGWGDVACGFKYRVFGNEKQGLALVAGLDVKFDSAGDDEFGTGTTNINPYIAASTVIDASWRPYVAYQGVITTNKVNGYKVEDSHGINIGVEYELNKTITVKPEFTATIFTGSEWLKTYESYEFKVDSYLQVFNNFYLIPSAHIGVIPSPTAKDSRIDNGSETIYGGGIALYYLFK